MKKVISKDGTPIAYDESGNGPPAISIAGATGMRAHPAMAQLASLLSAHFTVFNYDRRGRGDSGDTPPYAVEREIEDIEALIDEAGGSAFLYGLSSGAALALEAANKNSARVKKLALYEPPFIVDDSRPPIPSDYVEHLNELVAAGRRGDAFEYFLTVSILISPEYIAQMRSQPMWAEMESIAHTIAYDGTIMGDNMSGHPLKPGQWTSVTMPTLVMVGSESPPFFHNGTQALVEILPNAKHRILECQSHGVAPEALAPVLEEFFAD